MESVDHAKTKKATDVVARRDSVASSAIKVKKKKYSILLLFKK